MLEEITEKSHKNHNKNWQRHNIVPNRIFWKILSKTSTRNMILRMP